MSGETSEPRMSVWEAIASKRVVRAFADRPLEPDHLVRILNAGRRAASSKNLQRWDFIVCRDRGHLQELSKVGPWAGHLAGAPLEAVPPVQVPDLKSRDMGAGVC